MYTFDGYHFVNVLMFPNSTSRKAKIHFFLMVNSRGEIKLENKLKRSANQFAYTYTFDRYRVYLSF